MTYNEMKIRLDELRLAHKVKQAEVQRLSQEAKDLTTHDGTPMDLARTKWLIAARTQAVGESTAILDQRSQLLSQMIDAIARGE